MIKHIFYLASGNSKRFGQEGENKLLYPINGKPMYLHGLSTLKKCLENRNDCTLTVVSQYEEIRLGARQMGIRAVDSPDSVRGVSYTIKTAIGSLEMIAEEDFLLFVVSDQPNLTKKSINKLLDCANLVAKNACLSWKGRLGNPVLFSAKYLSELLQLEGDQGGKAILKKYPYTLLEAESEQELIDIDIKNE